MHLTDLYRDSLRKLKNAGRSLQSTALQQQNENKARSALFATGVFGQGPRSSLQSVKTFNFTLTDEIQVKAA
jgi:hypothetical protein